VMVIIMLVANNGAVMGRRVNGWGLNVVGWLAELPWIGVEKKRAVIPFLADQSPERGEHRHEEQEHAGSDRVKANLGAFGSPPPGESAAVAAGSFGG